MPSATGGSEQERAGDAAASLPAPYTVPGRSNSSFARRWRERYSGVGRFLVFFMALSFTAVLFFEPSSLAQVHALRTRSVEAPEPAVVQQIVRHAGHTRYGADWDQVLVTYSTAQGRTVTAGLVHTVPGPVPVVGQAIKVRYLPDDPAVVEPAAYGDSYLVDVACIVLGVLSVIYLLGRGLTRSRQRRSG